MVIETYQCGQTTIRIHDDCMARTAEENQAIIDRITKMVKRQRKLQSMKSKKESA